MPMNSLTRCNGICFKQWVPDNILNIESVSQKYAIVILNQPIKISSTYLMKLWEEATIRVTVDGGTDRWFEWVQGNREQLPKMPSNPDYVTGDFDSISKSTLQFLKSQSNVNIIETGDQSATDFTKALKEIAKLVEEDKIRINKIITIVESCGRLDQILSSLSTLFLVQSMFKCKMSVYLLAHNSLTWLLKPDVLHSIKIPEILWKSQVWCSLIPLKGRTEHVTTTGLKWNLNDSCLDFGEFISTSNTYDKNDFSLEVTVKAENYLIWSMGLLND